MKKLYQHIFLVLLCLLIKSNTQAQFYSQQITGAEYFFWGSVLSEKRADYSTVAFDTNWLDAGVYFVRIVARSGGMITKRIVVQ